ncbi:unnamed protein product [Spirodela intermedia]|uniref:Uncharacterized protein n=1 Tax=Spirodela intermedia TaxID=51605 RepID=A0ABN7ED66_SPIIN|nr:unnamed protein product [Spirodela intermedia]
MEVGACQGASSSGPRSKRRLFIASGALRSGGDSSPGGSPIEFLPTVPVSSNRLASLTPKLCNPYPCNNISLRSLEINEMGHRIVSNGCHPAEWKNGNLVTLRDIIIVYLCYNKRVF